MLLNLTDLSSEPLHSQISRQLRAKILAGHLPENESLPSIRALAREQRVSVITVQRAYDDLEREGLIRAQRRKGFVVAPLSEDKRTAMAKERFGEALSQILGEAFDEGLSKEQISRIFKEAIARGGSRKKE